MVFKKKNCISAKEDISRLPKEVVPVRTDLRGNERDGISSSGGGLKLKEKKRGVRRAAFLRKRIRREARIKGLEF